MAGEVVKGILRPAYPHIADKQLTFGRPTNPFSGIRRGIVLESPISGGGRAAYPGYSSTKWSTVNQNAPGTYTITNNGRTAELTTTGQFSLLGDTPKGPGTKSFEVTIDIMTGELSVGLASLDQLNEPGGARWLGHFSSSIGYFYNSSVLFGYYDVAPNRIEDYSSPTYTQGDVIKIQYTGTVLTVYKNGVAGFSGTCTLETLYGPSNVYPAVEMVNLGDRVTADFSRW